MGLLGLSLHLQLVGLLTCCLGVYVESITTINPQIYLFTTPNWDSFKKYTSITSSVADLKAKSHDMDEQSRSYMLRGTAILYEYENYNEDYPDGNIITMSHTLSTWEHGTHPQLELTSSVRIIGYNLGGIRYPSVTLFKQKNWRGPRAEHIVTSKEILSYSDSASLVIVGVSDWAFYDEINYGGHGDCLKGNGDEHAVRFLGNSSAIGFKLNGKSSVKKGCYGIPTVE